MFDLTLELMYVMQLFDLSSVFFQFFDMIW